MRFVMNQQWWTWGTDFSIKDETGHNLYYVDGKAFSFGDKLSFKDAQGNELINIRQKLLSWGPTYEIYQDENKIAEVRQHLFTLMRYKFTVDVPGPDDLEAEGDFFNREYRFLRGGRIVGLVSKQMFSLTDTYGIEVSPDEDSLLILASAVVIDLVCHDGNRNKS
jgi:uncharacterized protein YxjI